MNKVVKVSLVILALILIIGVVFYVKAYVIGSISYDDIIIDKVTLKGNSIEISGNIIDSSRAFKSFNYTQVDTEIYITIKSVMVSKKNKSGSFKLEVPVNSNSVNNIHLSDDKNTKVIYSK